MQFKKILAALSLIASFPAFADDVSAKNNRERLLSVGEIFIKEVRFPSAEKTTGFKTLHIGDSFNLDAKNVHSYARDSDKMSFNREPFTCKFSDPTPIFKCNLTLWNVDKYNTGGYAQELLDLRSAFGSTVGVSFDVLMNRVPTLSDIERKSFGEGRIISISVSSDDMSGQFESNAKEYFLKKFEVEPKAISKYVAPGEVYSPECVAIINRIKDTAESEITALDREKVSECERKAMIAFFEGKATSGSVIVYLWEFDEYSVSIQVISGVTNGRKKKESIVSMNANVKKAANDWKAEYGRVKTEIESASNTKSRSDF